MSTRHATMHCAIALLAAALSGCSITAPSPAVSPAASPVPSSTPSASTIVASPTPLPEPTAAPSEAAVATPWPTAPADCPVTHGSPAPAEVQDRLFGASSAAGNDDLWVGGLWPNGVLAAGPAFVEPDGSVGMKFGWWRFASGRLTITGRHLDGAAPPATGEAPDGYGLTGFQASGISFPTEGCWEITGMVGSATLTFVTYVIKAPA